jgi:Phage Mu protein F like protein
MARIEVATPAEILAAEEAFAAQVVAALGRVAGRSAETLGADIVTAATVSEPESPGGTIPPPGQEAAAVEDISIIPALWTVQVTATLMPELSAIYELSGVHLLTALGEAFPDLGDIPAVSGFAAAEQRLAAAQNRLVGIGDMLWEQARNQLLIGFAAGEDIGRLRDRVQDSAGVTAARAERIARTEVISASNSGSIDQVRAAGLIGTKTWLDTPDERTRCTHRAAGGQTVDLDGKFQLGGGGFDAACPDVGASYADFPGDPTLPASEVINCRCSIAYDVDIPPLTAGTVNDQPLNGHLYSGPTPEEGGQMPWHIVEDSAQCPASRPYAVVKDATGQIEGCHPSRMAATDHMAALYAAEQEARQHMAEKPCPEGEHRMPDGECMLDDDMPSRAPADYAVQRWEGTLAIEGVETGDGRMFAVEALTWRDLPIPLMYQKVTSHGGIDDVTVNVGSIDEIWRDGNLLWGRGRIDMEDPNGVEVARKMQQGFIRGVSIDADSIKDADIEFVFPPSAPGADLADDMLHDLFATPELTIFNKGRVSAATVVNIPAFQEAKLFLIDTATGALVAAGSSFAAVGSHDTATTGDSWDIGVNEKRLPSPMPAATGRNFYAWIDNGQVTDGEMPKDAGKFGHHMVSADGRPGAANTVACSSGIAVLHGGRGGTTIPDDDRRAVYDHLASHMRDAGMEPPAFGGETLGLSAADAPTELEAREGVTALAAAAYTIEIPDLPPPHFFEEPDELPPIGAMWVTAEGRIFGLVGPGDTAHRSFRDRKITIPMGNVDYTAWMNRPTLVAGGQRVATGVITMNCGHASPLGPLDPGERMKHYDNSCSIAAVVAVGESKRFGAPWMSGVLMPMTAEQTQRLMACQLSGDWAPHREKPGWREFVAALAVPVPGFARATKVRVVDDVLVSSAVPIRSWEEYQATVDVPELVTAAAAPVLTDEQRLQLDAVRDRLGLSPKAKLATIADRVRTTVATAPRPAPVPGTFEGVKKAGECAPCAARAQRRAAAVQRQGDRHRAKLDRIVRRIKSLQVSAGQGPAPPVAMDFNPGQRRDDDGRWTDGPDLNDDEDNGPIDNGFEVAAADKVRTEWDTYHLTALVDRDGKLGTPGGKVIALSPEKFDWTGETSPELADETVFVAADQMNAFASALQDLAAKSRVRPPEVDEDIGGVLIERTSAGGVDMAAYHDWGGDLLNEGDGVVALAYNGAYRPPEIEWDYLLELGSHVQRLEASEVGPILEKMRQMAAG